MLDNSLFQVFCVGLRAMDRAAFEKTVAALRQWDGEALTVRISRARELMYEQLEESIMWQDVAQHLQKANQLHSPAALKDDVVDKPRPRDRQRGVRFSAGTAMQSAVEQPPPQQRRYPERAADTFATPATPRPATMPAAAPQLPPRTDNAFDSRPPSRAPSTWGSSTPTR
jgi:hypothetical protein